MQWHSYIFQEQTIVQTVLGYGVWLKLFKTCLTETRNQLSKIKIFDLRIKAVWMINSLNWLFYMFSLNTELSKEIPDFH